MQKFKLTKPVKFDGVEVHEISLREPKVRDLIAISRKNLSDLERDVHLLANLGEISTETIENLEIADYLKIQNWLRDFLSPETEAK
ncbi:MAG: phage tail assembly protein [Alphaproteobacteria bacterium]|nr:phage tail assembly protein [Alphaproteobacteria bacterium]